MVDNEKMSAQVKTALAEMVLPETLDDIEEYLRPEFPPRYHVRKAKEDEDEDEINGRRIVMDGFGRWREIRPKKYMEKKKLNLDIDPRELPQMKELFRINSSAMDGQGRRMIDNQSYTIPGLRSRYSDQYQPSCQSSRQRRSSQLKHRNLSDDDFMYDSLGKTTRSNVFPGVGKLQWNTTTARTFTKQPITAVNERKHFFGIQSDDFGAWSAANVLNERMKKAWEEYLASAPKATAKWNPPVTQHAMPKPPPPKPSPKKNPPKTKTKTKKENIVTEPYPLQEPTLPSEPQAPQAPPPYVPADGEDDDDDFWEFYDKPFNKPK